MLDDSTHGLTSMGTQTFDPVLTAQMDNEEECASMALCQRNDFIKAMFGDETYSDVTIRCGDKDFKVHKNVICPISTVFASFFKHDTKEKETNTILHEEFDPATIQRLLAHTYTIFYDVSGSSASEDMIEHVQVYLAADYYDIGSLQTMALRRFNFAKRALAKNFEVAGFIKLVSEVYKCGNLQDTPFMSIVFSLAMENSETLVQDSTFMEELRDRDELQNFAKEFLRQKTEKCAQLQKELAEAKKEMKKLREKEFEKGINDEELKVVKDNLNLLVKINSSATRAHEIANLVASSRCSNKTCWSYRGIGMMTYRKNGVYEIFCSRCRRLCAGE